MASIERGHYDRLHREPHGRVKILWNPGDASFDPETQSLKPMHVPSFEPQPVFETISQPPPGHERSIDSRRPGIPFSRA